MHLTSCLLNKAGICCRDNCDNYIFWKGIPCLHASGRDICSLVLVIDIMSAQECVKLCCAEHMGSISCLSIHPFQEAGKVQELQRKIHGHSPVLLQEALGNEDRSGWHGTRYAVATGCCRDPVQQVCGGHRQHCRNHCFATTLDCTSLQHDPTSGARGFKAAKKPSNNFLRLDQVAHLPSRRPDRVLIAKFDQADAVSQGTLPQSTSARSTWWFPLVA